MNLSHAKYIPPNLITLSSAFLGFYAIIITVGAEAAIDLRRAAWLIVASMFLDGLDGRVARATKAQSEFGVQMDSLADAIAFGVAPAFLVFKWGLEPLGFWGVLIAFAFAGCGVMRLARFNVLASTATGPSNHFTGLPIPLAAATLISVVLAHTSMTGNLTAAAPFSVAAITLMLGGLMVSNFQYRSFKKLRLSLPVVLSALTILIAAVAVGVKFNAGLAFTGIAAAYILLGIAESAIGFTRRRRGLLDDDAEPTLEVSSDLRKTAQHDLVDIFCKVFFLWCKSYFW